MATTTTKRPDRPLRTIKSAGKPSGRFTRQQAAKAVKAVAELRDIPLEPTAPIAPAKSRKARSTTPPVDYGGKLEAIDKGNGRELVSKSHRIATLDQLLAHAQVDLLLWKVTRCVVNKWEVGAKDDKGKIVTEPLFQVKAWLEPRTKERAIELAIDDVIADMRKHAPRYTRFTYPKVDKKRTDGHLCVYAIPDLHIGKLCHKDETGSNYDSKIAARMFMAAVDELAQRTRGFTLDRILFIAGNDFFNVDNEAQTTTGGTPQDEDGRWQKTFASGRKLLVEAIDKLSVLAPVDVVVVRGNHDSNRVWYLGEVLQAWYQKNPQVTVFNEPSFRKYYEYGRVLLGLTHGDKEKMRDLPLIMATERPEAWARAEHREYMLGHYHCRKQHEIGSIDEFRGVKVRRLSSLTAPDAWHKSVGLESARSAEAFIFHPQDGCVGTFAYNLTAAREAELAS